MELGSIILQYDFVLTNYFCSDVLGSCIGISKQKGLKYASGLNQLEDEIWLELHTLCFPSLEGGVCMCVHLGMSM